MRMRERVCVSACGWVSMCERRKYLSAVDNSRRWADRERQVTDGDDPTPEPEAAGGSETLHSTP